MELVKITIRNYRTFGNNPQTFSILEKGFVSFVGPNNAGKTAILKFIYELRAVWNHLVGNFITMAQGNGEYQLSLEHLATLNETDEMFNHFTKGPINIIFQTSNSSFELIVNKVNDNLKTIRLKLSIKEIEGEPIYRINGISQIANGELMLNYQKNPQDTNHPYSIKNITKIFQLMAEAMFIPAFRNITNIGTKEKYYDINSGSSFIETWNTIKAGKEKSKRDKIQSITEDIKNLLGFKSLNIFASNDKSTLIVEMDNKSYTLEDLGTGVAQSILVFTSVALKEPSYLLIDEPELGLHSPLQVKFLLSLAKYCSCGILFATHSLGLARSVAEQIYFVRKENDEATIRPMSNTKNYAELLGELNYASYQELGLETLLLVEGATDVKVFQELLRKWNKDQKTLIMNLGGSSMICKNREVELAEIKRLNPNKVCVWIDSEKEAAEAVLAIDRQEFLKSCKDLGFIAQASHFRATENYFSKSAISAFKQSETDNLKPYEKLDKEQMWSKSDNWRIAQLCDKVDLIDTDLGKFLENI